MSLEPGVHALWPTPIGVHRFDHADALNPLLARVFGALRATQTEARRAREGDATRPAAAPAAFFASDDDLLTRIRLAEWQGFVQFVVESLRDTVREANRHVWPCEGLDLQVAIEGMWFQVANRGAFHDVHTHGNCSWSGVYCVQVDPPAERRGHPVYGEANGITRFYGPPFATLGGAHVDAGNAYLLPPHVDVSPHSGQLVVFPSWLAHQALPYDGTLDRVIVSFNASVHRAGGDRMHGYAAG